MPWTKIASVQYQRSGLRYASDPTDAERTLIVRKMARRRRLGRPRLVRFLRVRLFAGLHKIEALLDLAEQPREIAPLLRREA
jgi:hypothetical protein